MTMVANRLSEASTEDINKFLNVYLSSHRSITKLAEDGIAKLLVSMEVLAEEVKARFLELIVNPENPVSFAAMASFRAELRTITDSFLQNALLLSVIEMQQVAEFGASVTANAFAELGISTMRPLFSEVSLQRALLDRQRIFKSMVRSLEGRIMGQIQAAVLGVLPASGVIRSIEQMLRFSDAGRRIGFGLQAEAIVRTEVGSLYSEMQQSASEQIAETIPGLRKKWITTLGSRRGHRAVEAATEPGGTIGPIAIRDRFTVRDFSRTGTTNFVTFGTKKGKRVVRVSAPFVRQGTVITDKMLHPRDPSASAGNRINCTCIVIEVLPDVDQQIERSRGIISEQEI